MKQYLEFLRFILENGTVKKDRTGVGTKSIFGYQMRFSLKDNLPVVTTKKIYLKGVIYELLWFLSGDTNIKYLQDHGVHIWDAWADEKGELGPVYGSQWRHWKTADGNAIDQIKELIDRIKADPNSRRLIVNSWNVGALQTMALPPCHMMFQFYVANGELSCQLYQRSADAFLGVPFNITSYSLLTSMIAEQCGLKVGEFVWTGGDCHLYQNHLEQVKLQLTRKPYPPPKLMIKQKRGSIFDYEFEDFEILGYQCHPGIKGEIAV